MLPVPALADLARAFLSKARPDDAALATPWARPSDVINWFSKSAWSLALITRWIQSESSADPVVVWVPDFFCNQSLAGIREAGAKIVFYPVDEGRLPDWTVCNRLAKETKPDVFIAVHFFGIETDLVGTREFCNRHRAVIVEDCAHVLLPYGKIGTIGDFVIYSPHKVLAIPDGALLLAKPSVMRKLGGKTEGFAESWESAQTALPDGVASSMRWVVRRVLLRLFPWLRKRGRLPVENKNVPERGESRLPGSPGQSMLSRRLLLREIGRIESAGWRRADNAALLLANEQFVQGLPSVVGEPDRPFCYMLGVKAESGDAFRRLYLDAATCRVPISVWPDLPPEVLAKEEEHPVAVDQFRTTAYFPVHQTIRSTNLLGALGCAKGPAGGSVTGLELQWDIDPKEWNELYDRAPFSQMLQADAYLLARADTLGWKRRLGILRHKGEVCAVFGILEKRGPFGAAIGRLNRGPVWMHSEPSPALQVAVVGKIAAAYPWSRLRKLFVGPNIAASWEALAEMQRSGFVRRGGRPWHAVWVDLRSDQDKLMAALDGKWRNQLKQAEKKGVELECDASEELSEWMLDRHAELMRDRSFSGPSVEFVRRLRERCLEKGETYLVLRAMLNGEPVAGISVVRHGRAGTYMLGWNGREGRRVNANNFLLWNAAIVLKRQGCEAFELGGMDEWRTPGIAAFKRGMGGTEFRLVGEYRN